MSGYTYAKRQLVGNPESYAPKGINTRQFGSNVEPRLPNTKYVGNSFGDAITNDSPKYRGEDGVVRRVKVRQITPQGTYQFADDSTQSAKGRPKLAVNAGKESRQRAARSLTQPGVDLDLSGHKYQDINDHNKQAHHLLSIGMHGGALEGRSQASQDYIVGELAKDGFFTGDDRRNYVALIGNRAVTEGGQRFSPGKVHPTLDEHQGGVHSKNTITQVIKQMLPTREQFHQMSDDQVIQALKLSGAAARADIQDVKGIEGAARAKSEKYLQRQMARSIAQQVISTRGELPM